MYVVIGADHHGFYLKKEISERLIETSDHTRIEWIDVGCFSDTGCDYPEEAKSAVTMIRNGRADLGVLLCGTGVGMSIAANRFAGIYAGIAWNDEVARLNRQHDNVNMLVLPADYISIDNAVSIIMAWLDSEFLGGHYQSRIKQIDCIKDM